MANENILQGQWKELKGKVREKWGQLTDDELDQINGRYDQLIGHLQKSYGYSQERARREVDDFLTHTDHGPERPMTNR